MLGVDEIGKIRRARFRDGRSIKGISRTQLRSADRSVDLTCLRRCRTRPGKSRGPVRTGRRNPQNGPARPRCKQRALWSAKGLTPTAVESRRDRPMHRGVAYAKARIARQPRSPIRPTLSPRRGQRRRSWGTGEAYVNEEMFHAKCMAVYFTRYSTDYSS